MASRAHTDVELVPYDPDWPARFAESPALIRTELPEEEIELVGSTSAPGLTSKDTIDLAAVVDRLMEEARSWWHFRPGLAEAST